MSKEQRIEEFIVAELDVPIEAFADGVDLIASRAIDSLGLLQIVSFLESEFGIDVPDDEIVAQNFATTASMARLVESMLASTTAEAASGS